MQKVSLFSKKKTCAKTAYYAENVEIAWLCFAAVNFNTITQDILPHKHHPLHQREIK
jgi:hypothetical protein